ncbi:RNA polymerase sigma factor [Desulfovibrio sp. TomC]|uniref:RNA polymerase sigma factor n=1 Tax=Desulfovibrio sp. TomC TaxID=1562888 RepID=UPI00069DE82E|nr:RNA polymerase sigma factor [Desulfovibrio sp. TomC]
MTTRSGECVRPGGNGALRPVRARIRLDGIDDATLARAAAQGDQKAFAALVDRHRPGVTHLATRFCQEPAGVEDLAQEIFVKAYLNLGGLRDWAMFRSWLHRIAANTCIDWLRRRKAEVGLVGGLDESLPDEGELARGQAREAQRRLEAAMAVLGPKDRLLVALLGLEGKSVEEVAQLTGLSQVNVKVRAFRARRKLKAFLEKDHG